MAGWALGGFPAHLGSLVRASLQGVWVFIGSSDTDFLCLEATQVLGKLALCFLCLDFWFTPDAVALVGLYLHFTP